MRIKEFALMPVFQATAGMNRMAQIDVQQSTAGISVISDLNAEEWDEFVTEFDDTFYEQTHRFQGAAWGENRVRRVAIARDGKLVAMALALMFKVPYLKRGLALVKFAPLWRRKGQPLDRENLGHAIDALTDLFVVKEKLSLSIIPPADPRFAQTYQEELLARGFRHRVIREAERFLVNTTLTPDRQLASLTKTWRYELKKSLKNGLAVSAEESDEALADFDGLFVEMQKRKNYSNSSWTHFRAALSGGCPPSIRPTLFLARESGRAVAGAIVVHIGDTALYHYGASSARGAELKAGFALHWEIANWLSQRQCRWYDLGGGTRENGLLLFKKGFAGKEGAVAIIPGEFTLSRDPLSTLLAEALLGIRRARLLLAPRLYYVKQTIRASLGRQRSRSK
jgi:lipid II:glycine glycyltransferase (peptidoglycan interpeptide bridge formation enzyme)